MTFRTRPLGFEAAFADVVLFLGSLSGYLLVQRLKQCRLFSFGRQGNPIMSRIPQSLRETIARNIKNCRMKKYPGRAGSQRCAKDFGVCPQQWSQWERGHRTPNEMHMLQLAQFFKTTVEDLRRDKQIPPNIEAEKPEEAELNSPFADDEPDEDAASTVSSMRALLASMLNPAPLASPARPGTTASFFWLARTFLQSVEFKGIRLNIHFDKESLKYLAECLKSQTPDPKE